MEYTGGSTWEGEGGGMEGKKREGKGGRKEADRTHR